MIGKAAKRAARASHPSSDRTSISGALGYGATSTGSAGYRCCRSSRDRLGVPSVLRDPVRPLTIEGIRRVVHARGEQVGLAYLRPHDLRRTLAGILDARDTPIQDIRAVLRHDTIAATQISLSDNPLRANRTMGSFVIPLARAHDRQR